MDATSTDTAAIRVTGLAPHLEPGRADPPSAAERLPEGATAAPLHTQPERAAAIADVIRALGHPVRLCLAARLCAGQAYVGELAKELSTSQTIVSQQLRILRMHGLVAVSRSGGRAYYRLAEPRLRDFIGCVSGLCDRGR
ncbi:MAG: helix-turn-helix transcriptional regulator [Deltaproteobacteria bacterium]|jgi:ArsR family transcriptional regulator|nr:helix-turn-helix transcriptional regulator [Deltaproteobacteria bacterium]MBW2530676.1 helix-turn-helix transcriptional regulator [Deltaproteobacteria bacterium]